MELSKNALKIIETFLFQRTGQQLTQSRQWRLEIILTGVREKYGIDNIDHLAACLTNPNETDLQQDMTDALVNNETYFFRDRPTFNQLPTQILPLLASRRDKERSLKVWSAGCSTGQEAHSLSMEFANQPKKWSNWSISILGTDISQHAITAARRGLYSQFDVQRGLSIDQLLKHFSKVDNGWKLSPEISNKSQFQKHNVIDPAPVRRKFDLILCRNVLLYFCPKTRAHAFEKLHEALAPDGFLMLGAGETPLGKTHLFRASANRPSIFEPVV